MSYNQTCSKPQNQVLLNSSKTHLQFSLPLTKSLTRLSERDAVKKASVERDRAFTDFDFLKCLLIPVCTNRPLEGSALERVSGASEVASAVH